MCMADGGEPPDIYRGESRTARKTYRCAECPRQIQAGEQYHYAFMVYDGDPSTFRTCAHCCVAMRWLADNCGSFLRGAIHEDYEEHADEYRHVRHDILRSKVGRRREWKRFDGSGLMSVPPMPEGLSIFLAS